MKKMIAITLFVCLGFSLAVLLAGCKKSEQPGPQGQGTAANAEEKMKQAADATGKYLSDQKDKFIEQAKKSYAGVESETNQLMAKLQGETSDQWQQTKTDLQAKLQTVKRQLDKLPDASSQAWQETQQAFNDALDKLKKAYEDAKAKLQKEQTSSPTS
jgi:uncharacterized protein YukE